jgi:heme exporter protein A
LFDGLDLWLNRGDGLRVLGPNGVGKSSLMRMVAGLLAPSPLLADGRRTGVVHRCGSVALLDERHGLDESETLGRALALWARLDGPLPSGVLARLGLGSLLDVPVPYLSTGQKKRAAFARLLGQRAAIWLLDEPLNGLDTTACTLIEALIAEHRAGGGTVIVASHQPIALPDAAVLDLGGTQSQMSAPEWAERQEQNR